MRCHDGAGECRRFSEGRPHRHRRRRYAHCHLDAGQAGARTVLDGHSGPVVELAVSPDGKTLASASWDHTVRLWPLAGGAPRVLEGNTQNVNGVAFSPDGAKLISAGYDATVRIWQVAGSGMSVHNLPSPLNGVVVAPDGEIVAAGASGKVFFLSPDGATARRSRSGADPDHPARHLARRHADRRGRHPRLGGDDRPQDAQSFAHADRPRPAGLVGGVFCPTTRRC